MLTNRGFWPTEVLLIFEPHRHKHKTRPKLRDPEVCGREEFPFADIAKLKESVQHPLSISGETRAGKTSDVFEHDSSGLQDADLLNGPGK